MVTLKKDVIKPGPAIPFEAEAVIGQYDCVKLGIAEGAVVKTALANDPAIGFMHMDKATVAGQGVGVISSGSVWARSSGAVLLGDLLEATIDGEVKPETPANGVDQNIVGRALGASGGANELIPVLVQIYKYNNETV